MNQFEIVGYEFISYNSKRSNKLVEGTKIYVHHVSSSETLNGVRCSEFFFRHGSSIPDLCLGDIVTIYFDQYGNPSAVVLV